MRALPPDERRRRRLESIRRYEEKRRAARPGVLCDLPAHEKLCTRCHETKHYMAFSTKRTTRDGLHSFCRACNVETARASALRNPENVRTHQRGWKKRNPDKVREQERKDKARAYKRHGEKLRAQTRAYGAANRDKIRARYTSERGRMLRRLSQQRRIARITAAPCDLTVEKVERLVARFGGLCCYCGAPWSELDHLVPVARGGGLVVGNIVPACKPCNVAKNARALEEFLSRARDRSRGRQGPGT